MTIKTKLFLLTLFFVIKISGLWFLNIKGLDLIKQRLSSNEKAQNLWETATEIHACMQESRIAEKNFFINMDVSYAYKTKKTIDRVLFLIDREIKKADFQEKNLLIELKSLIKEYLNLFDRIVLLNDQKGYQEDLGLKDFHQTAILQLHRRLENLGNPKWMNHYYFLLYQDINLRNTLNNDSFKKFLQGFELSREEIANSPLPPNEKETLLNNLQNYYGAVMALREISKKISETEIDFQLIAQNTIPLTEELQALQKQRVTNNRQFMHQTLKNINKTVFTIGITSIFFLLLLGYLVAENIARPIRKITQATKAVSQGKWDQKLDISTGGEIGILAQSFTKMLDDLKKTDHELSEAREKIFRSEKLAALGKLAGMIGHELRNPLGAMKGNVILLKKKTKDPGMQKHLEILGKEINEAHRIISDILSFAKLPVSRFVSLNIDTEIIHTLKTLSIPKKIDIKLELDRTLPYFSGDNALIKQMFSNLILNAIQAILDKGTIYIKTFKEDTWINAKIRDTGKGIPEEHLEKIFEPLFTTKEKGTGLGLSLCQQIVEAHKGTISVQSEPGKGTEFTVKLPIVN